MTTSSPPPTPPSPTATTSFVARDAGDLVALPPLVLGFHPEESVVMLTFTPSGRSFHARIDLPRSREHQREVARILVQAARTNGVRQAAVLLYTGEARVAADQSRCLIEALVVAGVAVIDALRVHDGRWFSVDDDLDPGTPYDLQTHRFTAEHVVSGGVVRADRAELERSLQECDPPRRRALQQAVSRRAATLGIGRSTLRREALWTRERLLALAEGAQPPQPLSDDDAARVIVACRDPEARDVAWGRLTRESAQALIEPLSDVVRRCPDSCVAPVASLLAFACWLGGDGALAWCAIERCQAAEPEHSLARLVADLLTAAVSPHRWSPMPDEDLPLLRGSRGSGPPHR